MARFVSVKGLFDRAQRKVSVCCIMKKNNKWIRGCAGNIGLANQSMAELWGIWYGLKMPLERGYTSIVLFSESSEAIKVIEHPDPAHPLTYLVDMVQMIKGEAWEHLEFKVTDTWGNAGANALAQHYLSTQGGVVDLDELPRTVRNQV